MTTTTNTRRTAAHPQELAQLILDHPPACPPWCQRSEHPLLLSDYLEDCYYEHGARHEVAGSSHLVVTIADAQTIDKAYEVDPCIGLESVGSWGTDSLVDPAGPEVVRSLAQTLLVAADNAVKLAPGAASSARPSKSRRARRNALQDCPHWCTGGQCSERDGEAVVMIRHVHAVGPQGSVEVWFYVDDDGRDIDTPKVYVNIVSEDTEKALVLGQAAEYAQALTTVTAYAQALS